jgi:hypothetical protein
VNRSPDRRADRRTVLKSLGAAGALAAASPLLSRTPAYADVTPLPVPIDWHRSGSESKSSATLQVVRNPMIRRGSPIHRGVYSALRRLDTDYVRFVPWFP